MKPIEEYFSDIERSAAMLEKAADALSAGAKSLLKVAKVGDLAELKRILLRVKSSAEAVTATAVSVRDAWPLVEADEEALLDAAYSSVLLEALRKGGLPAFVHAGDIMAFPFVLKVSPKERAVRINGKKTSVVRPSAVVALLSRTGKPRYSNDRLLEIFYSAYRVVTNENTGGRAVTLRRIYEALTLLPGSDTDYTEAEFVRDIYAIDRDGPRETKGGATVALVGSTGTRNKRDVFAFMGPKGELVEYFGIQFMERQSDPANSH